MTRRPPARPSLSDQATRDVSRRSVLKFASLLGAGAIAAPALAACAGPKTATNPAGTAGAAGAAGGKLSIVLNRNLVSLDNKLNQYDAAVTVQRAVREALTKIGDDLKPELVLAQSFEQTKPTVWTVKLRDDIHYSDKSKVTVEDVETALKMYFQVKAGYVASQFPEQPAFAKVDDRTFTLTTKRPVVSLNSLMSNILITPAAANKPEELGTGLGTGPFTIADANSGTGTYRLVRNPNYWGTAPKLDEVNVSYQEEEGARVIAITSGQADVIDTITPESAASLKTKSDIDVIETPGTRLIHLFYNFRKPAGHPVADPKVREALSHAIDHDSLIKALMNGQVTSAEGVVPKTLAGFAKTGDYTYDPAKAKSMLAEAGATGLKLRFIWEDSEFAGASRVLEAISQMLAAVGVTAELKMIPKGGEINAWRRGEAGDWDVLANGYGNQTGLALTNLQGQYGGTAEKEKTRDTYHGFVVPEITALLDQAAAEADESKRNALLAQAQEKIWALWPAMWAWTPNNVLAKRKRVATLNLRPINSYDLGSVAVSG
ncbi:MAG TPA: ABC transporter substrate-binding protein [Intrasporangium sp.]|uniref:ABC transporter substrate-binding protein n=1 Tax=Intrasporangium sp. TaxID=1925024 RepID=UPI002D780EC2|nr:ABC transporter substrate-binding protein [Intrasporangium sp.]HET7397851.1 ABC transporter substrate-binding protein [Intrasporangium sp.]